MVEKVIATAAAVELIELLKSKHGPGLMFHQSGGCCDNSAANCYLLGELTIGAGDVYLGDIGGCPFYIGKAQYEYWRHTQLIIDVIEGHGGTFSLEGPEGKAFHTRSRVFTAAEMVELDEADVLISSAPHDRQHDAPDPERTQGQDHLVIKESRPARRDDDGCHQRRHEDQSRANGKPRRPGKKRRLAITPMECEAEPCLPADAAQRQQYERKDDG